AQNPCTVSTTVTCDSPAIFDLGGRALSITGKLVVTGGDGNGLLAITGASANLTGTIMAQGTLGARGFVSITTPGPVVLGGGWSRAVSGRARLGSVQTEAMSGNLPALGSIDAHGGSNGGGGDIFLMADQGDITIGGNGVNASASGPEGFGGSVDIEAANAL